MDNIAKKECQNDVINLLQEKEYNDDGVRMFFRNFVNIEVEKQLKDEVNKYKEKQKRRIIDVYNAFNEDIPNEIKKIKMLERLPFRTTLKDYERYFKIQCILSKLLYNGFYDFNAYKVIPYYEAISLKDIEKIKKYLEDNYNDENLLNNNIIGVSSFVFSNLIELENGRECDEDTILSIYKLAKSYGIDLSLQDPNLNNNIIKNSNYIRDFTNIEKVNSLMKGNIISKGTEIAMKDLESKYSNMIRNISERAKTIKDSNSQSRASLDMDRKQQEEFKLMKNKEIEEIEKAMNGLNEAFENIKTEWLNQNKKLKEAIKK